MQMITAAKMSNQTRQWQVQTKLFRPNLLIREYANPRRQRLTQKNVTLTVEICKYRDRAERKRKSSQLLLFPNIVNANHDRKKRK
jgi:hypothetical protein